jgi:aromatic ring-opening dioxygenase LigB subunit
MPLVSAAILPHGTAAVPGFKEGRADFSDVTRGMRRTASLVASRKPQTIVIVSPHNLRIGGKMAIVKTESLGGILEEGPKKVPLSWRCDTSLAGQIFESAEKRGLPVVAVNFGTSSGPESRMPLDWGTMVPLWFFPRKVKVVLITPSREIPWADLVAMGECVGEAARRAPGMVSFVASADQGHAHKKSGPYGFDKASEEYDEMVVSLVKSDRLKRLLKLDPEFVERAKPDSLWQMLILLGALKGKGLKPAFWNYSCPTYYGMLSAAYL